MNLLTSCGPGPEASSHSMGNKGEDGHNHAHASHSNPDHTSTEATNQWRGDGTIKMAQRLQKVADRRTHFLDGYFNDLNVDFLEKTLQQTTDTDRQVSLKLSYSIELLRAGRSAEAITAFSNFQAYAELHSPEFLKLNRKNLLIQEAVSWLRLGEQDNCLEEHNSDSCLFPIRDSGVHGVQRGSRTAIPILETLIQEFPDDLTGRWLINIAHMTLGQYPEQVPEAARIDPKIFASATEIGEFNDIASQLGVDIFQLSGGSIMDDFNGDGYLDLMATSYGQRDQIRYFENDRQGGFVDRTAETGLLGLWGGLNLITADYNNDGHLDFFILRGAWLNHQGKHPNSLIRNNGNGTFEDVTEEAGLMSYHPTQTGVWFDYNSDGWIDLYIGNESRGKDRHGCELFRNNGDGTFTQTGGPAGVRHYALVKGVVSADFNNDNRPDLYVSCLEQPNVLYRNDGPAEPGGGPDSKWKFTKVEDAGVDQPVRSFPTWFFDYDQDGWEDIFVAGYSLVAVGMVAADYLNLEPRPETSRIYRNNGQGGFEDVSEAVGMDRVLLAMGSNIGDLDYDGWQDCYIGTGSPDMTMLIPNVALRNDQGRFFQDITTSSRLGHLQKGHGVSIGDIDHDGDQDIYTVMGGAYTGDIYPNAFFENPGQSNQWIILKLEGVTSNRAALGARIKVIVLEDNRERTLHRTVSSGGSFGCNPLRQEIGLGKASGIKLIEVHWPVTGEKQLFKAPAMNRIYKIREDQTELVTWDLPAYKLGEGPNAGATPHAHHHP